MLSSPSASSSSSSSSDYLINPPVNQIKHATLPVIEKLECLRKSSSAFMIATVVSLAVCAILIGLSQANYLIPESPLYALCASVPLIMITIAIDCCLRSYARKNNIDPEDYFRAYQRPDPKPKDPKAKKTTQ